MKIGIITYAVDLSALAKKAEELGFDSLWAPEHNTMPVHIAPMNTAYRMHLEPDGTPQPLYRSGKFDRSVHRPGAGFGRDDEDNAGDRSVPDTGAQSTAAG